MNGKSAGIRSVLLDIRGALYQGSKVIPGAPEAVTRRRDAGLPIRFLTKSTRQPKWRIVEKQRSFGINVEPEEVMTPAAAACSWLEENCHSPHLLPPDLEEVLPAVLARARQRSWSEMPVPTSPTTG